MNASLRLGGGHALHAVRSGFEFEQRIRPAADDAADDFLVAAMLARTFAQNLDAPTLGFGITRVHAEQVAGKDGSLVAAGAGADFQEDIAVVVRILRHQQALQLEFLGRDARRELGELFLAHGLGLRVRTRRQLAGEARVALERYEAPVAFDQRAQSRILHRELTELVLTGNHARIREQAADFLQSLVQVLELAPDAAFHARGL